MNVCILFGGETGERSVSLVSGAAVGEACLRLGHRVRFLDPATGRSEAVEPTAAAATQGIVDRFRADPPDPAAVPRNVASLAAPRPDVVAILLHGGAGEGGIVQGMLDLLGIPYTGSGATASALTLDKVATKKVLRAEGIVVPDEILWTRTRERPSPSREDVARLGGFPLVVKPISGGSTVGLTIVRGPEMWDAAWAAAAGQVDPTRGLLVEAYVPGRELTVAVFDGAALPVVEIRPKEGFYDYERKYTPGATDYTVPADLPEHLARYLRSAALTAFRATDCRDVARVDFRLPAGYPACLEINTIPGMTPTSLVPKAAGAVGKSFDDIVATLLERARQRAETVR